MDALNQYIDHTLLKADASTDKITTLCDEAIKYKFKAVCLNSYYVPFAYHILKETDVNICTVVGFPLGASPKEVKALEAEVAIKAGAKEIDMVINISAVKDQLWAITEQEIGLLAHTCHQGGAILKVILETCLLTDKEIQKVCEIAVSQKADFVKTSTGFSTGGATVEHVRLMKQTVGDKCEVKASGGIRDLETAKKMIEAGATRLGTSSGVLLMQGKESSSDY